MGSPLNDNVPEGCSVNYTQLKDIFANYEDNSPKNISKPKQFKNQETSRLTSTPLILLVFYYLLGIFCKRESRGFSKIG